MQFNIWAKELSAFAFRKVILFLHRQHPSYCLISRLVALRAEMMRSLPPFLILAVTAENISTGLDEF